MPMSNQAREAAIRDKIASQLNEAEYCKTEYRIPINSSGGGRRRNRSMDVFVQHQKVKYIIEVKWAPRYTQAIGQLIAYQALHCPECKLVMVLYGTPAELAEYKPECQKVLTAMGDKYKIVLMTEVG